MNIISTDQEKYYFPNMCILCRYAWFSQAQSHMRLLDCMKCSTLNNDSYTQWFLSSENEVLCGRIVVCLFLSCLSITRAAGLLNKIYNSMKLRQQNLLIDYVSMSVYCHLKKITTVNPTTIQHTIDMIGNL